MLMGIFPFGFLFLTMTGIGTLVAVSSSHWLGAWMGLELNLMGFIPLMVYRGGVVEAEAGIKYFIIQSLGSGVLLFGSVLSHQVLMTWEVVGFVWSGGTLMVVLSLLLKMGIFPFHFWVPGVMSGVSWFTCLFLTTWQKIGPLFLLLSLCQVCALAVAFPVAMLMGGLSSLVGGWGGINQLQLRAVMAYSSIGHGGWFLAAIVGGETCVKMYFSIYFIISGGIFLILWLYSCSFWRQMWGMHGMEGLFPRFAIVIMLLSLGGLPPLLGFLGKFFVLWFLGLDGFFLLSALLLLGSLMSLYYYLGLVFSFSLMSASRLAQIPSGVFSVFSVVTLAGVCLGFLFFVNFFGGAGVALLLGLSDFF